MMGMPSGVNAKREDGSPGTRVGAMVFKLPDKVADTPRSAPALEAASHLFDPFRRGQAVQGMGRRAGARTPTPVEEDPLRLTHLKPRWLNHEPASSSRKTHAFSPDSSTTSK